MKLNELSDNPGATKARKRVGRGIGSGSGKTGGRGVKGQKSRTGVAIKGFEGGQMPLHRRLPKRGFTNIFRKDYAEITIDRLNAALASGKLDASAPINWAVLREAGLMRAKHDGVRLIGSGTVSAAVTLEVDGASQGARQAVEAAGGTLTVLRKAEETASEDAKGAAR
jgi:large subunit ribosomal protein L15